MIKDLEKRKQRTMETLIKFQVDLKELFNKYANDEFVVRMKTEYLEEDMALYNLFTMIRILSNQIPLEGDHTLEFFEKLGELNDKESADTDSTIPTAIS